MIYVGIARLCAVSACRFISLVCIATNRFLGAPNLL